MGSPAVEHSFLTSSSLTVAIELMEAGGSWKNPELSGRSVWGVPCHGTLASVGSPQDVAKASAGFSWTVASPWEVEKELPWGLAHHLLLSTKMNGSMCAGANVSAVRT
jgi:hypothetical protein